MWTVDNPDQPRWGRLGWGLEGRRSRPLIWKLGSCSVLLRKSKEASGWGGGGVGVLRSFMGIKEIKEGFQLSLEGSVFLEFLEARRAGSAHWQESFSFTGCRVPPKSGAKADTSEGLKQPQEPSTCCWETYCTGWLMGGRVVRKESLMTGEM